MKRTMQFENECAFQLGFGEKVEIHVNAAGAGLPASGKRGDILLKVSDEGTAGEWVSPADHAEEDNTRPITAAAVYTEIGNINALLATI